MFEIDNDSLLPKAQKGDKAAFSELVNGNMGLVKSIALRFRERGVDFEDLVQIGTIGLIKAIRNFDTSVGTRFSTYAVPMIMGEIKKYLRDDGIIKVSRELKRTGVLLQRKREEFMREKCAEPTVAELAALCGIEPEEAAAALEASSPLLSFSAPVGDGEATLENLVGSDNIGELAEKISLRQAIAALDETDRRIIVLRYWKGLSQSDVGRRVGMTQVMVSRREKRIISRLREELA